ncbi:MAG: hypothetical protein Q7S02_06615 [bacterium]|nr:hypothetical protein [bacterium]
MSNSTANLKSLFGAATAAGELSPKSAALVVIPDYGAQIQAGLGVKVDDVMASEVFLASFLIDDSGSIRFAANSDAVRDGHNLVVDALKDSKQGDGILATNRYLNGTLLYPFTPIDRAERMTSKNFDPMGGTPLFDASVVALATVVAKAQEFLDNGVVARTATLICTDGHDEGSRRATAADVKRLVDDMLRSERHIVAGMGVSDGSTDFRRVFGEMGIRDEWILTPGNTPSEVRRAFQVFSRSAVRASQSAGSFSQAAAGGFGTP